MAKFGMLHEDVVESSDAAYATTVLFPDCAGWIWMELNVEQVTYPRTETASERVQERFLQIEDY